MQPLPADADAHAATAKRNDRTCECICRYGRRVAASAGDVLLRGMVAAGRTAPNNPMIDC
jgi:hypothetical protein